MYILYAHIILTMYNFHLPVVDIAPFDESSVYVKQDQ